MESENKENKKPNLKIVDNSTVEIPIDKKEIAMLQENENTRGRLLLALGGLEDDYTRQKTSIIASINQNERALRNIIETLKKKYKIIGTVVSYDVNTNKLIVATKDSSQSTK